MKEASEPTARVAGLFPLIVRHAGAWPHYGPANGEASAYVAVLFQPATKKAMVLMTEGHYGASITNAAEELLAFIHDSNLVALGVEISETRWLYRDSEGAWDEIMPVGSPTLHRYQVRFRPVGKRTLAEALACIKAEGLGLAVQDMTTLSNFLRLSPS